MTTLCQVFASIITSLESPINNTLHSTLHPHYTGILNQNVYYSDSLHKWNHKPVKSSSRPIYIIFKFKMIIKNLICIYFSTDFDKSNFLEINICINT